MQCSANCPSYIPVMDLLYLFYVFYYNIIVFIFYTACVISSYK